MDRARMWIVFALGVSAFGGLLFARFRFPAGLLVGGIVAVSLLNIATDKVVAPTYLTTILQILSGTLIGSSFSKKDVLEIKKLLLPAVLLVTGMLLNNLLIGVVVAAVSSLDLTSALMGAIPGGVTESVIMADQLGANVPAVAVMQLSRLLFSLVLFPSLIKFLLRNDEPYNEHTAMQRVEVPHMSVPQRIFSTSIIGTVFGIAGSFIPFIPVPAMLASLVAVSVTNMFVFPTLFPRRFRQGAQIAAGVLVGSRVTPSTIAGLGELIVPISIMLFGFLVFHMAIAWLVSKTTRLHKGIAMFCMIPAGVSDIALVASEMHYQSPVIALLQMVRLLSCITIFPIVIKLFVLLVQ